MIKIELKNSYVVGRGCGGCLQGLPFYFPILPFYFHIQKGVLSNNRSKIKDQNHV